MDQRCDKEQMDPGTAVYDADGVWVGIVSIRNALSEHVVVQKGRWLPKEIYLPPSEIARVDDAGVHLRLSKDALKRRYDGRPRHDEALEWDGGRGQQPRGAPVEPTRGTAGGPAHGREAAPL